MAKTYTVTFDRIGRHHDVEPATFEDVQDPDELAALIHERGRRYLFSSDVHVVVDLKRMTGRFYAGVRNAGSFTFTVQGEFAQHLDP